MMDRYTPAVCLVLAGLMPAVSHASNYTLGGNCPSQGAWTQMALQQSKDIANAIRQIKDHPACKGIEQVMLDIQTAQRDLQAEAPMSEVQRSSQLESFPGEFVALKQALLEGGQVNRGADAMLMNRTLKAAAISADLNAGRATSPSSGSKAALTALFERIKAPTEKGLEMITGVMQRLPNYDECLIGHPRQGLAILSGAVKTAAAFSAAGEGVGDKLGNAIATFAIMARERRFTQALRSADETEFWFSVSCLLESATKNYCEAENAQEVLKYTKDEYIKAAQANRPGLLNKDNPLEGYYLMVRDLPTIQAWLQKVQFGATPRLRSDAAFKAKIWQQVTDLTIKTNDIAGYFNEQMILLRELPDIESKRNQLFTILDTLVGLLSQGDVQGADSALFFNTTINATYLPFFLIGRKEIPIECRVDKDRHAPPVAPMDYIRTSGPGGSYVGEFNEPTVLAETIEQKMNWVIAEAGKKASNYFRERLIVDSANLVNQTMSSQYLTVQKALQNVYNYLVRFEKRIITTNNPDDVMIIPSIRETKVKIQKVLKSYDSLRALGERMKNIPTVASDEELSPRVRDAAKKVIDTVFDEFNMWLQKDSFLTGRLSTMIQKDFQIRIKSGQNMSAYQQDLLTITQQHLLDKLISVHGVNPTSSERDLFKAQAVNKRSLNLFEEVFKDIMLRMIVEMKSIAEGRGNHGVREILDQKFKAERNRLRKAYLLMPVTFPYPGSGLLKWFFAGQSVRSKHRDLYKGLKNSRKVVGGDDKFGSYAQLQAEFCAQTLAFENRDYFRDVCKGTVMKSYYSETGNTSLDLRYDDYFPPDANPSKIRQSAELTSKNICAINTFNTRNLVQWMKDQDQELLDDGSVQY